MEEEKVLRMKNVPEIKDEYRVRLDTVRFKKLFDKKELESYKYANGTRLIGELVEKMNKCHKID